MDKQKLDAWRYNEAVESFKQAGWVQDPDDDIVTHPTHPLQFAGSWLDLMIELAAWNPEEKA